MKSRSLGAKIEPWGLLPAFEARELFAEQAAALTEGGLGLFILETFSEHHRIELAVEAIRGASPYFPLVADMTIVEEVKSLCGTTPKMLTEKFEHCREDGRPCLLSMR